MSKKKQISFLAIALLAVVAVNNASGQKLQNCSTWGEKAGNHGVKTSRYEFLAESEKHNKKYAGTQQIVVSRTLPDHPNERYGLSFSAKNKNNGEYEGLSCIADTYECNGSYYLRCSMAAQTDKNHFYEVLSVGESSSHVCSVFRHQNKDGVIYTKQQCDNANKTCVCYRVQRCKFHNCRPDKAGDYLYDEKGPPDPGSGSGGSSN